MYFYDCHNRLNAVFVHDYVSNEDFYCQLWKTMYDINMRSTMKHQLYSS